MLKVYKFPRHATNRFTYATRLQYHCKDK